LTFRSPGETAVVQEVWAGRVWAARPMTVVRDEPDLVALWFPRGTRWRAPTTPPTRPQEENRGRRLATVAAHGDWIFRDATWDVDVLVLMRPADWHAVWVSWLPDGANWGWYVNLQRPFRRTPLGFETMDLMLDVIVDHDRRWRWKDEDELETFVEHGVFDVALAGRARDEGRRVIERVRRNEPPFSEPWHDWRPDSSWPIPSLPERWEVPCR
jgi:hypothetical protein